MSQLWSIGDENSDDLIKKILKIVLENPQYLHADSYLIKSDIREELYCSLKNRAFFIGINTTNKPLLTSDSPVVFDNGVEGFNGIRLSGEGLEISFPISPNYVVIIINTKKYPHLMDDNIKGIFLDVEVVTDLNNLQFLQSVSQVYSKESFKWIYDGA